MTLKANTADIKALLIGRIDSLVRQLAPGGEECRHGCYWMPLNPTRADKRPGSFWIMISGPKVGAWADEATGDGAAQSRNNRFPGDIFGLIQYVHGLPDFKAAIDWARDWLGIARMPEADKRAIIARVQARQKHIEAHAGEREGRILDSKRGQAQAAFFSASDKVLGSPVETYLAARGIELARLSRLPNALRYMPLAKHTETGTTWPAMIACMTGDDGKVWAVHRTFLTRDGRGKAPVKPAKKIWPSYSGAAIRLWRGSSNLSTGDAAKQGLRETLVVCEGIEDGLSIVVADPGLRVWAVGTLGNIGALKLPECCDDVIVCADNDWGNPQAQDILDRGIEALIAQGATVSIARSHIGKDANALLKGVA